MLQHGKIPYEPGLGELIKRSSDRLSFSTDYSSLSGAEFAFITVSTPTVNGKIYLGHVLDAASSLSSVVGKGTKVVIKSTVVPGTNAKVREALGGRVPVLSNPEFLREGSAVKDTRSPERVVIGSLEKDAEAASALEELWSFTRAPVLRVRPEEAEMIKYAANSFLALKVSFINEVANLCESLEDCDVEVVAKAIGMDSRISPHFLRAGIGWGGSCFPKDTAAFAAFAREKGETLRTVEAAMAVNEERAGRAVEALKEMMRGLKGRRVCVLGVAFKPDTDDTRESAALKVIRLLKEEGAEVRAYDPKAKTDLVPMAERDECVRWAEGVVIATEWNEFKGMEEELKDKYVMDGRRVLDPRRMPLGKYRAVGLSAKRGDSPAGRRAKRQALTQ